MNGIKKILKFDKLEKSKIDILLKFFSVTSITILSKIILIKFNINIFIILRD